MSHFAIVCQQRNAELPVSSVPPEILCSIFRILQSLEPIFYRDPIYYPAILAGDVVARLGWMKVLHVMHTWRTAALGDVTLWTTVTSSLGRKAFEETLRRCRNPEAQFDVDISSSLRWDNLSAADYVIHRIQLENIASLQIIGRSLPLLQSHIQMPRLHSLRVHLATDGPPTLPRELPLIEAPALRELYIHNVIPCEHSGHSSRPLDIAPIYNLTYLNLSLAPDRLDWQPVNVKWILSQTPRLEYFRLAGYTLIVPDDETDADCSACESLHLDKLMHLELDTSFIGAAYLIWRIRAHREARIILVVDLELRLATVHLEHACFLLLQRHRQSKNSPLSGFRTVKIRDSGTRGTGFSAVIAAWREDAPQYLLDEFDMGDSEHPLPDFEITFMCGMTYAPTLALEEIISIISLDTVRNISLHAMTIYGFKMTSWKAFSDTLSQSCVKWLRLDGLLSCTFMDDQDVLAGRAFGHLHTLALFGARDASGTPISDVLVEDLGIDTILMVEAIGSNVVHVLDFVDVESAEALQRLSDKT